MTPVWVLLAMLLVAGAAVTLSRSLLAADATRTHLLLGARLASGEGPLHRLPAWLKLVGVAALTVATALLPPSRLWLPAGLLAGLCAVSRVPGRFLLARVAELSSFAVVAAVGALCAGDPARFGLVLGRALVTVVALVLLLATTPQPSLLAAARRLGLPPVLASMLALALRYLLVLLDEGHRLGLAFACRAVGPRDLRLARPLGRVVGALAVRTVERGERIHQAMLARGFDGGFPTLLTEPPATWPQRLALVSYCGLLTAAVAWPR